MRSAQIEFKATTISRIFFYVMAYGWIFFALYVLLYVDPVFLHNPILIVWFIVSELALFFLAGLMGNYCIIENDTLVIKNHIWFWKYTAYDLKKTYSIEYARMPKIGFGLRIKTDVAAASSFHGIKGIPNKEVKKLYHVLKIYDIKLKGAAVIE